MSDTNNDLRYLILVRLLITNSLCNARGDHTPLYFVNTCDNGVFNGRIFMRLLVFFPSLFVD